MTTTLQIADAGSKTLAAHGISSAVLTLNHQGLDTLQIQVPQNFDDAALINYFDPCILRVGDDVRFIGWLDADPSQVAGGGESMGYTLTGPWRLLERKTYLGENNVSGSLVSSSSGRVTLGSKFVESGSEPEISISASKEPIRDQLIKILDWTRTATGDAFNYDLPEGLLDFTHPDEERVDDTPGTLIRALLGYAPGTVMWWEYSGTTPVLHFGDSATMDLTQTLTAADLMLTPIHGLASMLAGIVRVVFLGDDDRTVHQIASAGDALALECDRELTYTFNIGSQDTPATTFAQALATWTQRLHIAASPQFNALDWDRLPGEQWGFSGKFARFSGKRSTCQQIVRDLFRRTEQITLGAPPPPAYLSKRVRAAGYSDGATPGDSSGGGGSGDEDETGTLTITIEDPQDDPVPGAFYSVGGGNYASGSTATLPAGDYLIGVVVPPDYVPPAPFEATVTADGTTSSTVTATFRDTLKLRRADGTDADEEYIKFDMSTMLGLAPADSRAVEFREFYIVSNGALKLVALPATEPYDLPEE